MARINNYLVYLAYRALESVVIFLPLGLCSAIGGFVGWMLYWFLPGYRKLVRRNLVLAMGAELGSGETRRVAHRHFVALGRNFLASMKLGVMRSAAVEKRVRFENMDRLLNAIEQGKGAIAAIAHMGPWELMSQVPSFGPGVVRGTLFQPLSNPFLNKHIIETRATEGMTLFDRRKGFYGPMKHLRDGGGLGILVDQNAGDKGVWCPFFGRLASTTNLAAMLSSRTGAPILPVGLYPDGGGRWVIYFGEAIETVDRDNKEIPSGLVTANLNVAMEEIIRRQPEEWFWVHNRWKTPTPRCLLTGYRRGVELGTGVQEEDLKPFRIVVRSPNWLGDACMSVPAIRAIKRGRPDAHVTVLCQEGTADLWRAVRHVDEVLAIPKRATILGVRKLLRLQDPFDVGILLPNSLRSALEMKLGGVGPIVGYAGHNRKWLLDSIVEDKRAPGPPEHHAWRYMRIASHLGADATDPSLYATRQHAPERKKGRLKIGLCPGAAYGGAKRYPSDQFARAVELIHRKLGGNVDWVIYGSAKDYQMSYYFEQECSVDLNNLVGQTSLKELVDELQECHLLISNDSGTMHLAGLTGVPTVALFGSTEPSLTSPLGDCHEIIRKHVECSPCFLRECPLDFQCMKGIASEDVAAAAMRIVERMDQNPEPSAAA